MLVGEAKITKQTAQGAAKTELEIWFCRVMGYKIPWFSLCFGIIAKSIIH